MRSQLVAADLGDTPRARESRRLILIGASNLTRGIGTALGQARHALGLSLDVLVAMGHGRSFGLPSRVLGRKLPAILDCQLWEAIGQPPQTRSFAVVTDIGNDLMYGVPVEQAAAWVEECLDRLAKTQAETVVTLLPIKSLESMSPGRFRFLSRLFFPAHRLDHVTALHRARQLDREVQRLGRAYGALVVEPSSDWYGFDPIHVRRRSLIAVWRKIFSIEPNAPSRDSRLAALVHSWYAATRTPALREWVGIQQRGRQPAWRMTDGTRISLF